MDDNKSCEPYFPSKNISMEENPKLLFQYFDKLKPSVVSIFDRKITHNNIPTNLEQLKVEITQNGKLIGVKVKNEYLEPNKYRKFTELSIEYEELKSATVKISSKLGKSRRIIERTKNSKKRKNQTEQTNLGVFTGTLKGITYYKANSLRKYELAGKITSIILNAVMVICMVTSLPSALILANVGQMIGFMRFVNLDYPANLLTFSKSFSKTSFTLIPNIIPAGNSAECNMAEVFFKAKSSCVGVKNTGGALLPMVVFIILNSIFFLINKLSEEATLSTKINWFQKLTSTRVINFYLLMIQKELLLSAVVRLTSLKLAKIPVDTIVQVLVILIYITQLITLVVLYLRKKPSEIIPQKLKDHPSLEIGTKGIFSHLNTSKMTFPVFYIFLIFIINCAYPILILLGLDQPNTVALIITISFLVLSLFALLIGPNRSRLLNGVECLVNLLISISYCLLMFLEPAGKSESSLTQKQLFSRIGLPVVLLCFLTALVSILNGLGSIVRFMWAILCYKEPTEGEELDVNIGNGEVDIQIELPDEKVKTAILDMDKLSNSKNGELSNMNSVRIPLRPSRKFSVINTCNWENMTQCEARPRKKMSEKLSAGKDKLLPINRNLIILKN